MAMDWVDRIGRRVKLRDPARAALARGLKVDILPEDDLLFATLNAYAQRLSGTSEPVASSPRNE